MLLMIKGKVVYELRDELMGTERRQEVRYEVIRDDVISGLFESSYFSKSCMRKTGILKASMAYSLKILWC